MKSSFRHRVSFETSSRGTHQCSWLANMTPISLGCQHGIRQIETQRRPQIDNRQGDKLKQTKRDNPPVNVCELDLGRCDTCQIKNGIRKRRRDARYSEDDAKHDGKPQWLPSHCIDDGCINRDDNQKDPDPIDKHAQDKNDQEFGKNSLLGEMNIRRRQLGVKGIWAQDALATNIGDTFNLQGSRASQMNGTGQGFACRISKFLFLYPGSGFTSPCPKETGNLPSVR